MSSLKLLSPLLAKDKYTLTVFALGELAISQIKGSRIMAAQAILFQYKKL